MWATQAELWAFKLITFKEAGDASDKVRIA